MTKNEKALDALCLNHFGLGFFDLPDLTLYADLFADGYSAEEVFDICCEAWAHDCPVFADVYYGLECDR